MIQISLKDKLLLIKFKDIAGGNFSRAVATAKKLHCAWNKEAGVWTVSAKRYDSVLELFSNVDIVDTTFTPEELEEATVAAPELFVEKTRRIPDYDLLNYAPIIGKHPYENFQKEAISKGINRSRYAYFFDMGTGKSYIASAIIAHRYLKYGDVKKVLFLTSSIGVRNLKDELCKFIKDLDLSKVSIAGVDNRLPFTDNVDIVISNYNSLRVIDDAYSKVVKNLEDEIKKLEIVSREKSIEKLKASIRGLFKLARITISSEGLSDFMVEAKKKFREFKRIMKYKNLGETVKIWAGDGDLLLLLDESHQLANPTSARSKVAAKLVPSFKYRYLFTGTPADVPLKLYNQFKILDPWLVYNMNFSEWKEKMAYMGTYWSGSAIRDWKKEELEKSNNRFIKSHGNYLKVTDVLDLPEFFEKRIPVDMSSTQRYIYEEAISSILSAAKDNQEMVNTFPYQMLAVDNPTLLKRHIDRFPGQVQAAIDKFDLDDLEKMKVLDDIVADNPDEKILVWAIHPDTIKYICSRYEKLKPVFVTGDTNQDERNAIVNTFKKDPKCKMLVANITTLSTSVTLSPECHIQVYMERGFQFDQYSQSQRRIFRIGSNQAAITYIPIYKNSLDYLVDKNLSSKGLLVKGLVSKEFLTQEEWRKIYNMNENTTLDVGGLKWDSQ